jgi:hypothetical protein
VIEMMVLLFKLLISHALCDFSLQTSPMASGKNRHNIPKDDALPPGQKPATCWPYWLTAHALIHAGGVFVVTGNLWAALAQLVTHWMFDFVKCEGFTNPHMDQLMHTCVLVITASILSMPA